MSTLTENLSLALHNRKAFLEKCHQENTDCYRLFHGTIEGVSGLTVDRYGSQLLIQAFHHPLDLAEQATICNFYQTALPEIDACYYHDRTKASRHQRTLIQGEPGTVTCRELGTLFHCDMTHKGQDPLLFLDFRAARRAVANISASKTLLNCFSFSCGIGTVAAQHGASAVTHLDFAHSALEAGKINAELNHVVQRSTFIQCDYFLATRQMAGLGIPGRKSQKHGTALPRFSRQLFDIVVLDPPAWAKSKFGTVDLKRDYPSVLKPALLCVAPQGTILCTNNLAAVDRESWQQTVVRCIEKNDRKIENIRWIEAEEDFPSYDNQHPLKQLLVTLA